jgi:hypothetical protein
VQRAVGDYPTAAASLQQTLKLYYDLGPLTSTRPIGKGQ